MTRTLSLLVLALALAAAPLHAQDAPAVDQEAMQAWMAYMTPGEAHEYLADQSGAWRYDMKLWMDPSAPPMESSGTIESSMMLGGRYQEQTFEGSFMGMPFEGHSLTGYDNAKEEYFNVWIDNMGTGMMETRGTYDPETKTLELTGTFDDPITGAEDLDVRSVTTTVDDDRMTFEMYMEGPDGEEFKTMEIHATRRSSP